MATIIAIGHILGALIVQSILVLFWIVGMRQIEQRELGSIEQAMEIDLDLGKHGAIDDEMQSRARKWMASRFSSELLRNRLSDLCGIIRVIWDWASLLAMASFLLFVAWRTFTVDPASAKAAWLMIPLWLGLSLLSLALAVTCKILTGRYPGQAKAARKALSQHLATT